MQLFHAPTSPFVRKVMVVLYETGQQDAVSLVPASGSPIDPGSMPVVHNPLGKIPALVLDDGSTLFDSRVICRYLDDRAGGRLYPRGPALWPALTREALADGIAEAAVLMRYETHLRPEDRQHEPWVEGQWSKIARALDALEAGQMGDLDGPVDIGRIALACALGYLDLRHPGRGWRDLRPGLAAWQAAFAGRPAMVATAPAP